MYSLIAGFVLVLVAILYASDDRILQLFIGAVNPFLAASIAILAGFISFYFLLSQKLFVIYKKGSLKEIVRSSVPALLFVSITILVDLITVFPKDLNILFPLSLVFYPAMGFFAEILFHIMPLSTLLYILMFVLKNIKRSALIWVSFIIISLLEPAYQAAPMVLSQHFPIWAIIVVFINLAAFTLYQLYILKRHDFISMYAVRLTYYLVWHIIWGYMRLRIIF